MSRLYSKLETAKLCNALKRLSVRGGDAYVLYISSVTELEIFEVFLFILDSTSCITLDSGVCIGCFLQ